jgi:hypothetical protein
MVVKMALPEFCEGCGRRVNNNKCRGWLDPSGCRGEHWATPEQVEKEERERKEYMQIWRK